MEAVKDSLTVPPSEAEGEESTGQPSLAHLASRTSWPQPPLRPLAGREGGKTADRCGRAALPDLVVAQAQHLQPSEAQEAPWDGLQLIVIQQQLGQRGMQA